MANIFRKKDQYIDRVNRSTFDLSFVNNLTMKFGAITPVCCLPVSFGDSFQINARFNLQLLPDRIIAEIQYSSEWDLQCW